MVTPKGLYAEAILDGGSFDELQNLTEAPLFKDERTQVLNYQ